MQGWADFEAQGPSSLWNTRASLASSRCPSQEQRFCDFCPGQRGFHCHHLLPRVLWGRSCSAGMGTAGGWLQWRVVSSVLCWFSTLEPTGLLEGVSSCELLQLQLLELLELELALVTELLFSSLTEPEHPEFAAVVMRPPQVDTHQCGLPLKTSFVSHNKEHKSKPSQRDREI